MPDINTSDKSNNKYDISVAIAAPKATNLGIRIIFIITFESALKEVSIANNLSIPCGKKYCVLKVVDHAIKSKILYRYWGGSRTSHFKFEQPISLKVIYKYVKFRLFKHALESFAAIGITNTVDEIDLGRVSSELKYYYLPYASRYEWLSKIYEAYRLKPEKKEKINVLLGHRGKSEGNHIELLKKLMKYNTYINIYIPLSYGNKDYISEVKKYVSQLNDPCITVISDFMKPEDYARLLCKMDIGIFDGVTSYALGNISMMLECHKTIYLKENGVIAQAFRKENIPYKNIENIGRVDVDEFIACFPEGDFDDRNMKLMPVSKNSMEERWSRVFEDFK